MEEMAAEGRRGAQLVLKELDDLSEYLSACQFGITLASLGIGFLGEPSIADLVEPVIGDTTLSHVLAIAIAYVIVTALHITLGEQVPKIFAIVRAESVAMRIARPLHWFDRSRSEEHTSELQSRQYLVCRLLLEKKKKYMY